VLVRTWNLFHGNALPPERRAFLREMVELVSADGPDVVCLQEVPVWALKKLGRWSGMRPVSAVAARPLLLSAELGRWITELHHGLFRSAFTGQANAILVAPGLEVTEQRTQVISRRGEGERRVCLAVRVSDVGVVGNFHATGGPHADEQFLRAAEFVRELDERVILCGDANITPQDRGRTYGLLRDWGFSVPVAGIDQILVRGLPVSAATVWPEERRRLGNRLLSDHAPVELRIG
jgi:endonuclease/exonuclease/phosphatase family metal-dependent hydrolase